MRLWFFPDSWILDPALPVLCFHRHSRIVCSLFQITGFFPPIWDMTLCPELSCLRSAPSSRLPQIQKAVSSRQ
jgi:hypothetical protein